MPLHRHRSFSLHVMLAIAVGQHCMGCSQAPSPVAEPRQEQVENPTSKSNFVSATPADSMASPVAELSLRDEIFAAMRDAESFEIFSLQPGVRREETLDSYPVQFHGWPVLGKADVSEPRWKKPILIGTQRMHQKHEGLPAPCFNPRHGLRVVQQGKAIECVICFECSSMYVYREGQERVFLVIGDGQEEFDTVLRAAGVILPDKNEQFRNEFNTALPAPFGEQPSPSELIDDSLLPERSGKDRSPFVPIPDPGPLLPLEN
jgi:hypothetical protein